ncbi:unnamed protein product, partial [Amoebophrya sp. A120]|eukprot:GSA120T00002679001.1
MSQPVNGSGPTGAGQFQQHYNLSNTNSASGTYASTTNSASVPPFHQSHSVANPPQQFSTSAHVIQGPGQITTGQFNRPQRQTQFSQSQF